MPGFNVVAEKVGLRKRMASTDIVITGEGRLDFQTLQGKAPYGVASLAKELDKPVWAIGGASKTVHFWRVIFDHLSSLVSDDTTLEQAMKNPKYTIAPAGIRAVPESARPAITDCSRQRSVLAPSDRKPPLRNTSEVARVDAKKVWKADPLRCPSAHGNRTK